MAPWGNREFISAFLEMADAEKLPDRWHRKGSFTLMLINQQAPAYGITKGEPVEFVSTTGRALLPPVAR